MNAVRGVGVTALSAASLLSGACGETEPAADRTAEAPAAPGAPAAQGRDASPAQHDAVALRSILARESRPDPALPERTLARALELLSSPLAGTWFHAGGFSFRDHELASFALWNAPDAPVAGLDSRPDPVETLAGYAAALRERGVDFVLVPIPERLHVYPERLLEEEPAEAVGCVDPAMLAILVELAERGVEVVDLFEPFLDERFDKSGADDHLLYHAYDRHWTPRGIRLAAERIAERLLQREGLPEGRAREGEDFIVRRERATWTPRYKPGLEESREPVELFFERVLRPDGGGAAHEKDRSSPVLVLGDSFSTHLDDEAADVVSLLYARLGLRLDTILLPGGGSVNVWQTLARRGDGLAGKRVLLWLTGVSQIGDPRLVPVDLFAR